MRRHANVITILLGEWNSRRDSGVALRAGRNDGSGRLGLGGGHNWCSWGRGVSG